MEQPSFGFAEEVVEETTYSVVQLMFGTPPRSLSAFTFSSVSARKKFGWMQAW